MSRPSDDELEAMAARLETRIIQSTMIADAAAMLRACKSGDVMTYPTVDQLAQVIRKVDGENTMGAGALAEAILAALEPAPDHAEWDAAIEAAAKKVVRSLGPAFEYQSAAAAIRTLKKGARHD